MGAARAGCAAVDRARVRVVAGRREASRTDAAGARVGAGAGIAVVAVAIARGMDASGRRRATVHRAGLAIVAIERPECDARAATAVFLGCAGVPVGAWQVAGHLRTNAGGAGVDGAWIAIATVDGDAAAAGAVLASLVHSARICVVARSRVCGEVQGASAVRLAHGNGADDSGWGAVGGRHAGRHRGLGKGPFEAGCVELRFVSDLQHCAVGEVETARCVEAPPIPRSEIRNRIPAATVRQFLVRTTMSCICQGATAAAMVCATAQDHKRAHSDRRSRDRARQELHRPSHPPTVVVSVWHGTHGCGPTICVPPALTPPGIAKGPCTVATWIRGPKLCPGGAMVKPSSCGHQGPRLRRLSAAHSRRALGNRSAAVKAARRKSPSTVDEPRPDSARRLPHLDFHTNPSPEASDVWYCGC